jgi:hypothetical protein
MAVKHAMCQNMTCFEHSRISRGRRLNCILFFISDGRVRVRYDLHLFVLQFLSLLYDVSVYACMKLISFCSLDYRVFPHFTWGLMRTSLG